MFTMKSSDRASIAMEAKFGSSPEPLADRGEWIRSKLSGGRLVREEDVRTMAATIIQKYARGMAIKPVPVRSVQVKCGVAQKRMLQRWKDDSIGFAASQSMPIQKHPGGWNKKNHYMDMGWCYCGQSCPCCRARVGDTLGACGICVANR